MSPEQQRIAIAEACGWVKSQYGKWSNNGLILPDPLNPPDYLNDLNAMHEAEKILNSESGYHGIGGYGLYLVALEHNVSATAAERAEAFLRTIGEWKEARK